MFRAILILETVFWIAKATPDFYTLEEYKDLTDDLLRGYSNKIRPIWNQGQSLPISVSLWVSSVNEVSAVDQRMSTTAYLYVTWIDESLWWNATETGIETMQFNQKDLWIPDIVLKNGFTAFQPLGGDFYYLYVESSGKVQWYPYMVLESKCEIDVTYFPFDRQMSNIIFKTWSYSRLEVNLTVDENEIGFFDFVSNSVWEVTSIDAWDDVTNMETDVTFSIYLRRKPYYFIMSLVIPVIFLGILNPVVFIIPADAGEKMGYAVTIFLTFVVFLTIVSTSLPANSDSISIMSIYLVIKLLISALIIFISSLQLRLNHRKSSRKIPRFHARMVRCERRLRCIRNQVDTDDPDNYDKESKTADIEWSDVSSAVDFFAFWIINILDFTVTGILFYLLLSI
uniref:Neuronal acetylcholine receptor subunit alpha-6 n=1 Tax=Magallana gigas TaxID=29159 RepID=A0A8W8MB91_MAGGI|nr:neuronal acetylcholine receptor subunit alpha-6-like [Crassostrea gigas]